MLPAAVSGFLLGAGLIIAIGAQNAFVLRQGLRRRHVFAVCLVCALSDALLIAVGVGGPGTLIARSPDVVDAVTLGGAAFLSGYAVLALRRAWRPAALSPAGDDGGGRAAAVAAALAFTFLNPHVYIDTVLLIGGLSARHAGTARIAYGAGAALASFVWFFGLGYGARLLAPFFARPSAWRLLDLGIAAVMATLAVRLLAA